MFGSTQQNTGAPAFNFGQPNVAAVQPQMSNPGSTFSFNLGQQNTLGSGLQSTQPTGLTQGTSQFSFGPSVGQPTTQLTSSNPLQLNLTNPLQTNQLQQQAQQAAADSVSRGLGGEGSGESTTNTKSPKDSMTLHPDLVTLVESFKNYVKEQKMIHDENCQSRFSVEPILDISSELDDNFKLSLQKLDVVLQKNSKNVDNLKKDTSTLVADAETAYRAIKSFDSGLMRSGVTGSSSAAPYPFSQSSHHHSSIPAGIHSYFSRLLENFNSQMDVYSKQIKLLQDHMENINKPLEPQEMMVIVRRQHETLIALAAEIYAVHEQIEKLAQDSNVSLEQRHHHPGTSSSDTQRSARTSETTFGTSTRAKSTPPSLLGPDPFASPSANRPHVHSVNPQETHVKSLFGPSNTSFSMNQPTSNFSFGSPNTSSFTLNLSKR